MIGAWAAGVSWSDHDKLWQATIFADTGHGERLMYLGGFKNEFEAALAREQAALHFRVDKAQLNFPGLPPLLLQAASSKASTKRAWGEQVRTSEGLSQVLITLVVTHLSLRVTCDLWLVRRRRR
jgi:hypothetical protein